MNKININFDIDSNLLSTIIVDDINVVAKYLLLEWINKQNNKTNNDIDNNLCNIINELTQTTKDIFGLSKTSQKRGEIIENNIYHIFENNYQNYAFIKTNHIPHHADAKFITPDNQEILIELKNYKTYVDKKEIDKLKFDMKHTKIKYGLFLSIQSGIAGKKTIDIEIFDHDYTIVYISYVFDEIHKIQTGITLLETLNKMNTIKNVKRLKYLEDRVIKTFEDIKYLSETITILREKYSNLENNIKNELNSYYYFIRDNELKIKEKTNQLWIELNNDLSNNHSNLLNISDLDKLAIEDKSLFKIIDIIKKYNCQMIKRDNNIFYLNILDERVGEIKKLKNRIDIQFYNPNILIKFDDKENNNLFYFETLIKTFIL